MHGKIPAALCPQIEGANAVIRKKGGAHADGEVKVRRVRAIPRQSVSLVRAVLFVPSLPSLVPSATIVKPF